MPGPANTTVYPLDNATLTCSALAYPAPFIQWYRQMENGSLQLLTDTTKHSMISSSSGLLNRTNELTFVSVLLSDAGTYVCQANSGSTNTTSSASLTVLSELIIILNFTYLI